MTRLGLLCVSAQILLQEERYTDTIFPKARELLGHSKIQRILFKRYSLNTDDYESMMDALFCETFTEFRVPCMDYYAGTAPQLRDILAEGEVKQFDKMLVGYLLLAAGSSLLLGDWRDLVRIVSEVGAAKKEIKIDYEVQHDQLEHEDVD